MEIIEISVIALVIIYFLYVVSKYTSLKVKHEELGKKLLASQETSNNLLNKLNEKKLESLKFTLNPHSFKNTLDSIQHVAKSTLSSVENLSVILDYMLYETKDRTIAVSKEIDFAKKYFSLYKLKVNPVVSAKFNVDSRFLEAEFSHLKIAPLVTAHFIENAFKHGDTENDESFIDLSLELLPPNSIVYSVRNKIKSYTRSTDKGGIGNSNFKERLELLYPDLYHLDSKVEDGVFSSNLKITLNNEA
jgi:two-component system, LytTR family, sensor kinase